MGNKLNIEPLSSWGLPSSERPLVIAGPCSAESEDQMIETAKAISKQNIHIFRAGIWKPRTRPGSFEGIGNIGLQWLRKVKQETGMLTSTEVATVKHVYDALKAGVDILWIGARTTVNPFAVQDLADALQGVDIPVMIKNPINPDLELWIGAIERINKAGITKIAAIHRGFSSYEKSSFRNPPQWQIPIELRRRIRTLPIICDPSHICGNRELLQGVSQKAMDMNQDGLIIESHINPDKAISDAKQQLTPDNLEILLSKLVMREKSTDNPSFQNDLDELRGKIDEYDSNILNTIGERMEVAKMIGQIKKDNNVTVLQTGRWDEIVQKRVKQGTELGLSEDFVNKILKAIHQESINHQTELMSK